MDNGYLKHYGVLGMKWGVRRTPTQLGHKTKEQKLSEKKKKVDSKNRGTLTVDQLKKKIERLQMEKQLRELTESELNPGRKAVKSASSQIGTKVATTAISGALLYGIKAAVTKQFDTREFGNAVFNGGPKKK
mgnify:CR=1 FL=1